ncbi:MAG: YvcK family protein [Actinobacteria bacterium]|nr:YvcK family protein [Actinomycetota bacterium]
MRRSQALPADPAIVVVGGGTGLATLISGLKHHTPRLTAVVTVADDGGSSGRLRREIGIVPPGDIRNCLVALAEDESLMGRLFQYRFEEGQLAGHSFGNLFLAALAKVTDDFEEAVRLSSKILAIRGAVLPASLDMVSLKAELADGSLVSGQSLISASSQSCRRVWLEPETARPTAAVLEAISSADLLVVGPGSLFTSIIPNFLITAIAGAVNAADCPKLFVCNVMTQPGETLGFTAADHMAAVTQHAGMVVTDTVLVNSSKPPRAIDEAYREEGAQPVAVDAQRLSDMGVRVLQADMGFASGDYFRHDSTRLAVAVMSLLGVHQTR